MYYLYWLDSLRGSSAKIITSMINTTRNIIVVNVTTISIIICFLYTWYK